MNKKTPSPCLFVMFGGTGDLMQRKILPTLHQLAAGGQLNAKFHILGIARDTSVNDKKFRVWAGKALAGTKGANGKPLSAKQIRDWCEHCIHFEPVNQADPAAYERLAMRIATLERSVGLPGNRVFYLALPPGAFPGTIESLGKAGLNKGPGWTRLVIEKPFGHDLASARDLNELVHQYFEESQVYRIDHYLGKETVQNLLAFRFANAMFESVWNRDHIKSVQITVAESLGIEGRAGYYENAGALRDMVQNHLTQLLSLTAMEAPAAFDADAIRFEKIKVLRSIAPIAPDAVVFGQYAASKDKKLAGYKQEPDVSARSHTETFVALRLEIENWRWQGVPFYLRTGKRMARRVSEIAIHFRQPPIALFRSVNGENPHTNALVITVQPDEGFELSFDVKKPGEGFSLQTQRMAFRYAEAFGTLPDGYETLLMDVIEGDQTLFVHAEEAEASWKLYTPLLEDKPKPHPYPAGSCGPKAADELGAACGTDWRSVG